MEVLVFNPGSSSLKFEAVSVDSPLDPPWACRTRFKGVVEPIGDSATLTVSAPGADVRQKPWPVRDHGEAAERLIRQFMQPGELFAEKPDLLACRVVHGGGVYHKPAVVDVRVLADIDRFDELAPLHNASSVAILRAIQESALADIPAVAVFDSSFHHTLPEVAYRYGIDLELADRHRIRRYGFHGISHRYLMLRYCAITGTPLEDCRLITLHMGGGASATAIREGRSVDTSMGFTPLEGLMMGTRSGDIDPALVGYLAAKEDLPVAEIERWLNKRSGLLGVSGRSQDTRVLTAQMEQDPRSRLALEIFSYRAKKYVGSYLAALGGASAIVFGGGIGENTPIVRRMICEGLEWAGLHLDHKSNEQVIDREGRISIAGSSLHAFVIPTREAPMMAVEAVRTTG